MVFMEKKKPYITIGLIITNIIVFILLELRGNSLEAEYMMEMGAVYPDKIQNNGEYWRLLTSTFMHFGFRHLLNNMVLLGTAGQILERALGPVKYFILYILSGVGGSTLSYIQMIYSGDYAVAAGASGAIFGIVGALLWVVICNKGHYETLTGKGLVVMILLCLYYGISTGGVDNWGHIGGLFGGFFVGILFYKRKKEIC